MVLDEEFWGRRRTLGRRNEISENGSRDRRNFLTAAPEGMEKMRESGVGWQFSVWLSLVK